MAVGTQMTEAQVNAQLTGLALQLRSVMEQIDNFSTQVSNAGTAGMEAAGFSPTDAAAVLSFMGYMSTITGVYYGKVQQGGTGGTGASTFDFDNQLSALWGGQ